MARTIPNPPRVQTTKYENFCGVDLTNNEANAWRKRSPDGLNIMPDEAGNPVKRHGWELFITNEMMRSAYGVVISTYEPTSTAGAFSEVTIDKRKFHSALPNEGVYTFTYNGSAWEYDDIAIEISNYGISYVANAGRPTLGDEITVTYTPVTYSRSININRCYYFELAGEDHIIIFTDVCLFSYRNNTLTCISDDVEVLKSYERTFFFEGNGEAAFYIYGNYTAWLYRYDENVGEFKFETANETYIPTILYAIPANGEGGELLEPFNILSDLVREEFQDNSYDAGNNIWRVNLSKYIAATEADRVKVWTSVATQFDTELTVLASGTPTSADECVFHEGATEQDPSYIIFYDKKEQIVRGEDCIRVEYPRVVSVATPQAATDLSATAVKRG